MKQIRIIIAIAAVIFGSCTKDIEYNGPDSDRMLIVNSITASGDVPVFKVSHSAFFLDSYYRSNELKSGVTVNVDINGEKRSAVYVDSLKGYTDSRAIHDNDIISVEASHALYGTATACDTVPQTQDILFSEYTKGFVQARTMSEMFDDFFYDFDIQDVDSVWVTEIEIPDNGKSDYYMMTIEPSMTWYLYDDYQERYDTLTRSLHLKLPSDTKVLLGLTDASTAVLEDTEADSQYEYGRQSYIFNDLYIKDGKRFCFDILMEKPDTLGWIFTYDESTFESGGMPHSVADKIKDEVLYTIDIKLYVMSGACYYYHKSVKDYRNADDISFLSEPVTILHNVQNGAGILATYTGKSFHTERLYRFK